MMVDHHFANASQGAVGVISAGGKPEGALDVGSTYRLTVPPNAPVKLYWSATVYDRATHALIRDQKWSSRASTTPGLQKNADGTPAHSAAGKAAGSGKRLSGNIPTSDS